MTSDGVKFLVKILNQNCVVQLEKKDVSQNLENWVIISQIQI